MKILNRLFTVLLLTSSVQDAFSQIDDFLSDTPRTSIGIEAARFRVSYKEFDNYFDSRWGFAWGGYATVRISSSLNIALKYRQFNKNEMVQIDGVDQNLDWKERWINAGVRYIRLPDRGVMNFFGFGASFVNVEGTGVTRILPANQSTEDGKVKPTGFFLDFGVGYPLIRKVYLLIEIEITSVGIEGSGGLESSSIGGIYIGAGLNLFPF